MVLVFDFDGTIVDSKKMNLFVFEKSFKKYGFSFNCSQIEPHFGPSAKKVIEELIGKKNQKINKKIEKEVDFLKKTVGLKMMRLRAEPAFFQKLKKHHCLILRTNADRASTIKYLRIHKIFNLWQKIITPEDKLGQSKIKTLQYLKDRFKRPIVYIGDMKSDIKSARTAGVVSVAIAGWEKEKNLRKAKPDFLINRLNKLPKILKIIEG